MGAGTVGGEHCEGKDRLAGAGKTVNVVARLLAFLSDMQTLRWVGVKHLKSLSKVES